MNILQKFHDLFAIDFQESKGYEQYESLFLQLADERRTVSAFDLQELLETCLPNGKFTFDLQELLETCLPNGKFTFDLQKLLETYLPDSKSKF